MLRAMVHGTACLYYRWLLSCMHPTHPDHGPVALRHALHRIALDQWLDNGDQE